MYSVQELFMPYIQRMILYYNIALNILASSENTANNKIFHTYNLPNFVQLAWQQ